MLSSPVMKKQYLQRPQDANSVRHLLKGENGAQDYDCKLLDHYGLFGK